MVLLLLAAILVVGALPYVGQAGARRFDALPEAKARAQHESLGRATSWIPWSLAATAAVNAALLAWVGQTRDAWIGAAAAAVGLAAVPVRAAARSTVAHGMARRDIEPLRGLPGSRTRTRRVRWFGAGALACYLASQVLVVISDETGADWLTAVALVLVGCAAVGAVAVLWTMAWKFSDEEQPVTRSQP